MVGSSNQIWVQSPFGKRQHRTTHTTTWTVLKFDWMNMKPTIHKISYKILFFSTCLPLFESFKILLTFCGDENGGRAFAFEQGVGGDCRSHSDGADFWVVDFLADFAFEDSADGLAWGVFVFWVYREQLHDWKGLKVTKMGLHYCPHSILFHLHSSKTAKQD